MIHLNGTDQYAIYSDAATPQGVPTYAPLANLMGYPMWISLDVLAAGDAGMMVMLTDPANGTRHVWFDLNGGTTPRVLFDGGSGIASGVAVGGDWNRVLLSMPSRTGRLIYVNGVAGAANNENVPWPIAIEELIVGARHYGGGAPDYMLDAYLANLAFGLAPLTEEQCEANVVGVNPQSLGACVRNWPLKTDFICTITGKALTPSGGLATVLSEGAIDHPEVDAWPPSGGPLKGIGQGGGRIG